MNKLNMILSLSTMVLITTTSQATNYEDRDCVHSYDIMNKYVNKTILNKKLDSNIVSMKINSDLAMSHATDTVINCIYVRPELSYKAQENFDEIMAIEEAVRYAKEYEEREGEIERIIAEV